MMLRTRNANQAAGAGQDAPVKRAATKQLPLQEKATGAEITAVGEPAAKRRAPLSELREQLSGGLVLESTRKAQQGKQDFEEKKTRVRSNSATDYKFAAADKFAPLEDAIEEEESTAAAGDEQVFDPAPHYDFDAENTGNDFEVPCFAWDIFVYYRQREGAFKVGDYLAKHPKLSKDSRAVLVDWMIEIQETFELNHETLYLAVKLVDIFLQHSKKAVNRSELQLIACAAVFVASKYDERQPPLIDDFLYVSEDAFTKEQLETMELELLNTVAFDLGAPLSYSHVRRLAKACKVDMQTLTLARYVLETSLMYYEFVPASESKIAAGAFFLALKMTDPAAEWMPVMHKYSGYAAEEVEPWMWELNHMMYIRKEGAGVNAKLLTAFQKYSHEVFFKSAEVPLIADKYAIDRPLTCPN
ncbi:hypothetical protein PENTCL1PPCAC_483 [Pristionchus entomophagus]|uniref:G2/mitotic-specific cyclin-B3 n=1 Tax=Pristionchus entomophagus TaxID=358040 RepID=A0AAV5S8R6_9BILA|nr:hypothetical protein PENTCL1PPCAC_483 [Pristionchus entomophagus]